MALRSTSTLVATNPTVGDLREMLEKIPASADSARVSASVYQDRPFDPTVTTISVTFEV